ncbi:MAG TPA: MarR family transcriptional regulator [Actinomycetes bacterium]|nr:MarR family transcriptional regulator [Actinomycetes bacterium]
MAVRGQGATGSRATGTAREIWELLLELSRTQFREHLNATIAAFDLSLPQAQALQVLEPGNPVPMRDLAASLRCDASNITGIVDRLEKRGLVERHSAPGDRRVKALVVTIEGAVVRAKLVEQLYAVPAAITRLSPAEQRTLLELLRRLVTPATPPRPGRPRIR